MRIISYVVLMRVARVGVRQSDKKITQLCLLPRLESCGLFFAAAALSIARWAFSSQLSCSDLSNKA